MLQGALKGLFLRDVFALLLLFAFATRLPRFPLLLIVPLSLATRLALPVLLFLVITDTLLLTFFVLLWSARLLLLITVIHHVGALFPGL